MKGCGNPHEDYDSGCDRCITLHNQRWHAPRKKLTTTRLLAVHPQNGVYLGHCLGMHFWSELDPVDQPSAVTFIGSEDIGLYNAQTKGMLDGCKFLEVEADNGNYASRDACVRAGAPRWEYQHHEPV